LSLRQFFLRTTPYDPFVVEVFMVTRLDGASTGVAQDGRSSTTFKVLRAYKKKLSLDWERCHLKLSPDVEPWYLVYRVRLRGWLACGE